jgi:hypothetical protein
MNAYLLMLRAMYDTPYSIHATVGEARAAAQAILVSLETGKEMWHRLGMEWLAEALNAVVIVSFKDGLRVPGEEVMARRRG